MMVQSGPKTLDFGTVSVNGITAKSFCVLNELTQNVLVTMDFQHEEMAHR
jgi:hypothetical protein